MPAPVNSENTHTNDIVVMCVHSMATTNHTALDTHTHTHTHTHTRLTTPCEDFSDESWHRLKQRWSFT